LSKLCPPCPSSPCPAGRILSVPRLATRDNISARARGKSKTTADGTLYGDTLAILWCAVRPARQARQLSALLPAHPLFGVSLGDSASTAPADGRFLFVKCTARGLLGSPKCHQVEEDRATRCCQIIEQKPMARRSPHSVMMEEAQCESRPSCRHGLSPPSETGEGTGSGVAPDPATAAAVQLASRASHLTLSSSEIKADLTRTGRTRMDATTAMIQSPAMPSSPTSDAQPCLEIVQNGNMDKWRHEEAINTPGGVSASTTCSSLELESGTRIAETHAAAVHATDPQPFQPISAGNAARQLLDLPNEVLLQILSNLDVCDLLATSRVSAEFYPSLP